MWDFYLYWGDPALHHFVVLAFVIGNAEVILKVSDVTMTSLLVTVGLMWSVGWHTRRAVAGTAAAPPAELMTRPCP